MDNNCITTHDLCVGQSNSDGLGFYIVDATVDEDSTTKVKIKDYFDLIVLCVKRSARDSDDKYLFRKKYSISDPDLTDLSIAISASETQLPKGYYYYEIKGFKPSTNYSKTIIMGKFTVIETVIDSIDGSEFES